RPGGARRRPDARRPRRPPRAPGRARSGRRRICDRPAGDADLVVLVAAGRGPARLQARPHGRSVAGGLDRARAARTRRGLSRTERDDVRARSSLATSSARVLDFSSTVLLAILALIVFGVGFTIHWLFIARSDAATRSQEGNEARSPV